MFPLLTWQVAISTQINEQQHLSHRHPKITLICLGCLDDFLTCHAFSQWKDFFKHACFRHVSDHVELQIKVNLHYLRNHLVIVAL